MPEDPHGQRPAESSHADTPPPTARSRVSIREPDTDEALERLEQITALLRKSYDALSANDKKVITSMIATFDNALREALASKSATGAIEVAPDQSQPSQIRHALVLLIRATLAHPKANLASPELKALDFPDEDVALIARIYRVMGYQNLKRRSIVVLGALLETTKASGPLSLAALAEKTGYQPSGISYEIRMLKKLLAENSNLRILGSDREGFSMVQN